MVYLMSIHNIGNNFGTTLQACALYDYISLLGYEATIINYRPAYSYNKGKLGQLIKRILYSRDARLQSKRYNEYYRIHSKMTREVRHYKELSTFDDGDLYIIGSDQVWNPHYNSGQDLAYYLGFVKGKKKMSYSASVGQVLSPDELSRLVRLISEFNAVSVREECSKEQLAGAGVQDVVHVVDPVFLHGKEYYIKDYFQKPFERYILVYGVTYDENMETIIEAVQEELKLPVVLLGGYRLKYKNDLYYRSAGPEEFVNLIYNCDFFIANSFHGVAFSIMFERQFIVVEPKVASARIISLLNKVRISNRIICNTKEAIGTIYNEINYETTRPVLSCWINDSKQFLGSTIHRLMKERE